MKILLLLLTFIFINSAWCGDFYLYHEAHNKEVILESLKRKDPELHVRDVFTLAEKNLLKKTKVHTDILKIQTKLTITELNNHFPNIKIENVAQFEIQSIDYTDKQWHLNNSGKEISSWISDIDQVRIQAVEGEDIQSANIIEKSSVIKVAVIDSGIDLNHPDLAGQIINNPKECEALAQYKNCLANSSDRKSCHEQYANLDMNQNGYPLDCQGWSVTNNAYPGVSVTGNPELNDLNGHGTHVAGIIAALKNNFGTTGIIQNAKIIPIQVSMNSSGENAIDTMAKGVLYAINAGAQVINLSLGWRTHFDSKLMREMIALAIEKNILVVVAGGNNSHSDISYPCAYEDTICVAAHNETGQISSFSNTGTSIDLIAPGTRILSTWPTNLRSKQFTPDDDYEYLSGTSQAAPIVTGAIAKLLNQGLTPAEVRIKLLAGTRKKKDPSLDIRFGNLDIQEALNSNQTHLLYPVNKTPYLVKWEEGENHKFRLRLKNYGKKLDNIIIKIHSTDMHQSVITKEVKIESISENEIFEKDIHFVDTNSLESELKFKLTLEYENESFEYALKAHYIRLIDEKSSGSDLISHPLKNKLATNSIIRPFNNITNFSQIDFFVSEQKGNKQNISLLKYSPEGYIQSKVFPLKENNPVFLNFSKVDLEGDGEEDYVVMYVIIDQAKNKITKFMIFDHDLMPKRYLLSPKNEFDNSKTFIPGKFKWLKHAEKMVPAWIGYGEAAQQHYSSPWNQAPPSVGNYFYYLTETGLKNYKISADEILLHNLYQSPEQTKNGVVEFITTSEIGFEKNYFHYLLDDKIKPVSEIRLDRFFDILELSGLQNEITNPSIFFHEDSLFGGQNILLLESINGKIYDEFIHLTNPLENELIRFVHAVSSDKVFYQTNFKIGFLDRNTGKHQLRESKVDTKRRRYHLMLNSESLYLPSAEAPGMTSELLRVNDEGRLISDPRYRTLALNQCQEFGNISNFEHEYIGYICAEANKLLFLEIK